MNQLGKYFRPYRVQAVLAPLFKMLEAFMDLFVPLVVADLIDTAIVAHDMKMIMIRVGLLVVLALVSLGFAITAQFFSARCAVGFACDIREALFVHVSSLSLRQNEKIGADTLMTRLTSDINQIQTAVNMGLRLLLRSPFIVFGSFIMALTIDHKAAIVFATAIPLLLVIVLGIMLVTIPMFKKVQGYLDRLSVKTRENLSGVRVIRAFTQEQKEVQDFKEADNTYTSYVVLTGRITALLNPVTFLIVNLAVCVLIHTGAIQVEAGILQQGQVVALYNYMAQMIVELIKLSSLMITLNKGIACAARVSDVLAIPSELSYGTMPVESNETGTVCFEHVSASYHDHGTPVVQDISFTVKEGEMIGIIGGTGSGKSTLVRLLTRTMDPKSGSIQINGKPLPSYPKQQLSKIFGIVPQKAVLFSGTIRQNMQMGKADASDEEIHEALTIAQADEIVAGKKDGLDTMIEQGGRNLSGGQKQRLTIARAIVSKPQILILDDSSSALDYAPDAKLRQAIAKMKNCTVFLISQRISTVRQCDQILVLDHGRLVGNGTHESLLSSCSVYQQINASQSRGEKEAA